MSCILCKRTGGIFNLCTIYGNANHTVRDDIMEILGVDVEPYICATDCVCNVCMNMLENVAKLKWRLWRVISNENQDCKPINLGKIWELFATFKREEDDREDDAVLCRTPTPSNLLTLSHSRDYNPSLEEQIQIMERNRSLSRASSGVSRSDMSETSELMGIFNKKGIINKKGKTKRKRRKGSNWTHRKNHSSSATSEFSNRTFPPHRKYRRQNDTPLSDCSYISYYTMNKDVSPKKQKVQYDEQGRRIRKRTRSVSREQEKEAKYLEQFETAKFYCTERDCSLYFEDLDVLNHHKIMDHNLLALHYCDECHQKYTTAEHLKWHKKIHEVGPFWCLLCLTEMRNQEALQEHLEQHASYSVPCKYCDKSFLSKSLRESHLKSAHSGRRERIVYNQRIIMDRIDKDEIHSHSNDPPIKIFPPPPNPNTESYSTEVEVTSENLRLMNIDFTSCAESSDLSELIEPEPTTKIPVEVL